MILDKYKFIYEKIENNIRTLWATESVPSDADTQLKFKDASGADISDEDLNDKTKYSFFYEKAKQTIFGNNTPNETIPVQMPTESDTQINVYIGDELLFGVTSNNNSNGPSGGNADPVNP